MYFNVAAVKQTRCLFVGITVAAMLATTVAQNSGYATYSNGGGGVCSGGSSTGLPGVAMNAAQFGGGSTCGQCVQIQGTGNGAGKTPVSTAPFMAVVTNVCPQCNYGDLDLEESGDGKFAITWSFVSCPGGRKLIEADSANADTAVADAAAPVAAPAQASQQTQQEPEAVTAEMPIAASEGAANEPIVVNDLVELTAASPIIAEASIDTATPVVDSLPQAALPLVAAPSTTTVTSAADASPRPATARKLLRSF